MKRFIILSALLGCGLQAYPQGCCSGGSGSPIAGGASQGVLSAQQMELSSSFQYFNSNKFKAGSKDTASLFDNFNSKYQYTRLGYGITKQFTFSTEVGYFYNKTQVGLNKSDTISSSGFSDLILFPRYNVLNVCDTNKTWEVTLGLGYKLPIGKHDDSTLVYEDPTTGEKLYTTSPPLVQPTNGSQDIIFYAFVLRGFPKQDFKLFANATYIKKGWNSLGQKFGDYAGLGIFVGKTFFDKLNITLQVKGEWIDSMKYNKNIDMLALYNIDVRSTGSRRLMFVPQLSYSINNFTVFGLYEQPMYQYVDGVQVATQHQFTCGAAYRFYARKTPSFDFNGEAYQCTMRCEGGGSNEPGNCKVCGMKLKKVKKK